MEKLPSIGTPKTTALVGASKAEENQFSTLAVAFTIANAINF
jgi:hypothetical protein